GSFYSFCCVRHFGRLHILPPVALKLAPSALYDASDPPFERRGLVPSGGREIRRLEPVPGRLWPLTLRRPRDQGNGRFLTCIIYVLLYTNNNPCTGESPMSTPSSQPPHDPAANPLSKFSDVRPRPAAWLWRDWLPLGKLAILDGDPGLGKST